MLHSASINLEDIEKQRSSSERRWATKIQVEPKFTRALVSFQANKGRAVYRWFKYKEGFSAELIECLITRYKIKEGVALDPFAGSGTALFVASSLGIQAEGIELLPIGQSVIQTRRIIEHHLRDGVVDRLKHWADNKPWKQNITAKPFNVLRITKGAYVEETFKAIESFLGSLEQEGDEELREILLFALLCILEKISYTRKDGQYLRWDYRSGRRQGKKRFDKGKIYTFDDAMIGKLHEIINDLNSAELPDNLFATYSAKADIKLHNGSCLKILPRLNGDSYSCIITSPPYCNRYDYTRTYALELALLGVSEEKLSDLRQEMISCTVENRAKDLIAMNPKWENAITAAEKQSLLQNILSFLDSQKKLDLLNNNGIPRMIRGYFFEMACVIYESARVLRKGAPLIMVNDNVRYAGASIPVDIILSEIAEQLGFVTEKIFVLPNNKGNSSQQMDVHGRDALRKCVYVWRKE